MQVNTSPKKHIFIMSSDADTNRGETFYAVALAKQLKKDHGENVVIHFFKHSGPDAPKADSKILPTTIAKYSKHVPVIPSAQLSEAIEAINPQDSALVIGAGGSTLNSLVGLKEAISEKTQTIESGWMTHKAEKSDQVELLAANDIAYIGPKSSVEGLKKLNPEAAEKVHIIETSGVPTGTTASSLRADRDRFFKMSAVGREFKAHVFPDDGPAKPFVSVVGNAGFGPKIGDDRVIVTAEEAYENGKNLGHDMAAGTVLLFTSPGPRMEDDYNEILRRAGTPMERPDDAFARGYLEAQFEKGATPTVFVDKFKDPRDIKKDKNGNPVLDKDNQPVYIKTNGANATIAMTHLDNNVMLCINDEGEGMKAMSPELANMDKTYVLKSSAIDTDRSGARQASSDYFEKKGLARLFSVKGQKGLSGYEKKEATTAAYNPSEDPAVMVLRAFGQVNKNLSTKNTFTRYLENKKQVVINVLAQYTPNGELLSRVTKAATAKEGPGNKADLRSAFFTVKQFFGSQNETRLYGGGHATNDTSDDLIDTYTQVMKLTRPRPTQPVAA